MTELRYIKPGEVEKDHFQRWAQFYNVPFGHLVSWGVVKGADPLSHGCTTRSLAAASGMRRFAIDQEVDEGFLSADTVYVVSTDAGDTGEVTVYGVDNLGNFATATVTATGTTPVAIAGTWNHIQKCVYSEPNTDNVGTVYVSTRSTAGTPTAGDAVQTTIEPTFNYAVNPHILVPNNQHYCILKLNVTSETKTLHVRLERDTSGDKNIRTFELDITDGFVDFDFPVPFTLKEGDKLRVLAGSLSGTVAGASFGFNGYILRNDQIEHFGASFFE